VGKTQVFFFFKTCGRITLFGYDDKRTRNVRQETVTHRDARAFQQPEDVVEDMEHLYKDRTVFESVLHVIGGFKNNL
jgi:muramoyltetrapeptide carboxypeptidase LdcA involved in peptidoglycan recycling